MQVKMNDHGDKIYKNVTNKYGTFSVNFNEFDEPMIDGKETNSDIVARLSEILKKYKTVSSFEGEMPSEDRYRGIDIMEYWAIFNSEEDVNPDNVSRYAIVISGGQNGSGKWDNYFQVLSDISRDMYEEFGEITLFDITNDVGDDIWYATFGIYNNNWKEIK